MTRQATNIHGKTVVAVHEGRDMGTVDKVYINPGKRQVAGLTVRESRFGGDSRFVHTKDVEQLGEDFIFVPRASACRKKKPTGRSLSDMIGMQVTSRDGSAIGFLVDLEVDEEWNVAEMDLTSKKYVKLEPKEITFGEDVILISKAAGSRVRKRGGKKKKPGFLERVFGSESVTYALEAVGGEAKSKSSPKKKKKKAKSAKKKKGKSKSKS